MSKGAFLRRMKLGLTAFSMLLGMTFVATHELAAVDTAVALDTHYGIVSLDLGDFNYYAFEKSKEVDYGTDYFKYGAGIKMKWILPPDVKEGDSFTLELPAEVNVDNQPDPNKIFFTVKDQTAPDNVVLNVYFKERKGEHDILTFVATKYAETKANGINSYSGDAVIGNKIDSSKIKSIYNYDIAASQSRQENAPKTDFDKNKDYYQGFRPNYSYFNDSPNGEDTSSHKKTLTYKTKYMNGLERTLNDETSVSYRSQLFYDGYMYTRFGDLMIQPIKEDADSVTYMILYNVAGTGQAAGGVTQEFRLSTTGFPQYDGYSPDGRRGNLSPYNGTYTNSMTVYRALPRQGTSAPRTKRQIDATLLGEKVTLNNAALNQYSSTFTFPDDDNTYYIELKMRKRSPLVKTPSGGDGYFMALFQDRRIRRFILEDFYHGTTGTGNAVLSENPDAYITRISLNLTKVDEKDQPLKADGITFTLRDQDNYDIVKTVSKETGTVSFTGLLKNHTYTLTETTAAEGYKKNEKSYTVKIDEQGNITIDGTDDDVKLLNREERRAVDTEDISASYSFKNHKISNGNGYFKVIHKYYVDPTQLENDEKPETQEEEKETEGKETEKYAASKPKEVDGYRYVKVKRSHEDNIQLGADNNSTVEGNYVKDEHLTVTYYYLKIGHFIEKHEYYESEEAARAHAPNTATKTLENPRTDNQKQSGDKSQKFNSEKHEIDNYVFASVESDSDDVQPNPNGDSSEANFIPGETITYTYRYYKNANQPEVPTPDTEKGSFQVIHKYYSDKNELDKKSDTTDSTDKLTETSGTAEQTYAESNIAPKEGYDFVSLDVSNPAIQKNGDENGTVEGNYIPKEHLTVTYYYLKKGEFKEIHKYFDSQEAAESGTGETETVINPRSEKSKNQRGNNLEDFTSQQNAKDGYTFLKVTSNKVDRPAGQNGENTTGKFIPGETVEHTYIYYKQDKTPEEPGVEENEGFFKVVHKYYSDKNELDQKSENYDSKDEIEETSGNQDETYASSEKKEKDDYEFVSVETSNESVRKTTDGNGTEVGNYVPDEHLLVTYYYIKKGKFQEIHQYFNSEEEAKAGTAPALTKTNPRTDNKVQSGNNEEEFTSKQNSEEGYVFYSVQSDNEKRPAGDKGADTSGKFIPGVTVTHTYRYYKQAKTPEEPDPNANKGFFKVTHKYYSQFNEATAKSNNYDSIEEIPETSGTAEQDYAASEQKLKDKYELIATVASEGVTTKASEGNNPPTGTEAGKYQVGKHLEVTYYYLLKGEFKEVHNYYETKSDAEAGINVKETVVNPNNNGVNRKGHDQEDFSSEKILNGYTFLKAESDKQERPVNQNGEVVTGKFIPGEVVTHTYTYYKTDDTATPPPSPEPEEPGNPNPPPVDPGEPGGEEPTPPNPDPNQPVEPSEPDPENPNPVTPVDPSEPGGEEPTPPNPEPNQPVEPSEPDPENPDKPDQPDPDSPDPGGEEEPKGNKGYFKVIHKYYSTVEDLNEDNDNTDETDEIPETSGTGDEEYGSSNKNEKPGYDFVKVTSSDESVGKTPNNDGTTPGNYIPDKTITVTYYYLKKGEFKEVHEFYRNKDDAEKGNNPEKVEVNPRTGTENQRGNNQENFTSVKTDNEEYVFYNASSSTEERPVGDNGSEISGKFIPGVTVVHTYRYYKDTEPNKPGEPDGNNPNDPSNPDGNNPNKPGEPDGNNPNDPSNPDGNNPNKPGEPNGENPDDPNSPDNNNPKVPGLYVERGNGGGNGSGGGNQKPNVPKTGEAAETIPAYMLLVSAIAFVLVKKNLRNKEELK